MKRLLVLLCALSLSLSACTGDDTAIEALTKAGFTQIEITGTDGWSCGEHDWPWGKKFIATNPIGLRVTGTVCSGWFKGSTIRY